MSVIDDVAYFTQREIFNIALHRKVHNLVTMNGKVILTGRCVLILKGELVAEKRNAVGITFLKAAVALYGKDAVRTAYGNNILCVRIGKIVRIENCQNIVSGHIRVGRQNGNSKVGIHVYRTCEIDRIHGIERHLLQPVGIEGHIARNFIGACYRLFESSIIAPTNKDMLCPIRLLQSADESTFKNDLVFNLGAAARFKLNDKAFQTMQKLYIVTACNVFTEVGHILCGNITVCVHICGQGIDFHAIAACNMTASQVDIKGIYKTVAVYVTR